MLFKYEQGKRSSVEWVRNSPTPTGPWHTLKVAVAGPRITGCLDGKARLTHEWREPVGGRVGVWSKADSVVCLEIFQCGRGE